VSLTTSFGSCGPIYEPNILRHEDRGYATPQSTGLRLVSIFSPLPLRRGSKKAAVAVGHSILVICYHVLEHSVPYEELGEDYFDRRRSSEAYAKRVVRKLERVGHKVALDPLPQTA
jgi:hypothetical protein